MYKHFINLITVIFLIIAASGCSKQESKTETIVAVKKVMADRKQAIEAKDIEKYKSLILPTYNDGRSNFEGIINDMQSLFTEHESIKFTYQRSTVDLKMNSARMVGNVSYKTEKMEKPVYHHETTLFRRVDGKWYISGGVATGLF